jgi:hypothetical protein
MFFPLFLGIRTRLCQLPVNGIGALNDPAGDAGKASLYLLDDGIGFDASIDVQFLELHPSNAL